MTIYVSRIRSGYRQLGLSLAKPPRLGLSFPVENINSLAWLAENIKENRNEFACRRMPISISRIRGVLILLLILLLVVIIVLWIVLRVFFPLDTINLTWEKTLGRGKIIVWWLWSFFSFLKVFAVARRMQTCVAVLVAVVVVVAVVVAPRLQQYQSCVVLLQACVYVVMVIRFNRDMLRWW